MGEKRRYFLAACNVVVYALFHFFAFVCFSWYNKFFFAFYPDKKQNTYTHAATRNSLAENKWISNKIEMKFIFHKYVNKTKKNENWKTNCLNDVNSVAFGNAIKMYNLKQTEKRRKSGYVHFNCVDASQTNTINTKKLLPKIETKNKENLNNIIQKSKERTNPKSHPNDCKWACICVIYFLFCLSCICIHDIYTHIYLYFFVSFHLPHI